jgi:hypothetical protein
MSILLNFQKEIYMVTTINRKTKKNRLKELVVLANDKNRLLDASKYSGKIKIVEKPLKIQKKLRDEWN